ncbi:MAG: TonB-dependent receptor plug domain-containing protein, partial [Alistipes sp.]|nr:TonB-dependent receptor plug domain-containing protein [Alistipes sp.]
MSILLLATKVTSAQTADSLSTSKILNIDEVTVTGYKSSPVRSVMTQTSLFDRDVAAAAPLQSMEAALRLTPSIDIRERGGKAVQADISVRGGSFDQTQVMLNGINFTDARTGHQSHSLPIDIECISAIELIEDVAGVGAYAGAVNIRTAPLHPRYLRFEGSGGSYGSGYGSLSGAVTSGDLQVMGAASYRRSDGYRYNTDYDNVNAYARATYNSQRAGMFDFQAGYQRRAFGSNGFYGGYNPDQWEQTSTALGSLRWIKAAGAWTFKGRVNYRRNHDRYYLTRGTAMNLHV